MKPNNVIKLTNSVVFNPAIELLPSGPTALARVQDVRIAHNAEALNRWIGLHPEGDDGPEGDAMARALSMGLGEHAVLVAVYFPFQVVRQLPTTGVPLSLRWPVQNGAQLVERLRAALGLPADLKLQVASEIKPLEDWVFEPQANGYGRWLAPENHKRRWHYVRASLTDWSLFGGRLEIASRHLRVEISIPEEREDLLLEVQRRILGADAHTIERVRAALQDCVDGVYPPNTATTVTCLPFGFLNELEDNDMCFDPAVRAAIRHYLDAAARDLGVSCSSLEVEAVIEGPSRWFGPAPKLSGDVKLRVQCDGRASPFSMDWPDYMADRLADDQVEFLRKAVAAHGVRCFKVSDMRVIPPDWVR